jgi:hypothetical protein
LNVKLNLAKCCGILPIFQLHLVGGGRETQEEVGIEPKHVDVWGCLPELASSQKGDYIAVPVVGNSNEF